MHLGHFKARRGEIDIAILGISLLILTKHEELLGRTLQVVLAFWCLYFSCYFALMPKDEDDVETALPYEGEAEIMELSDEEFVALMKSVNQEVEYARY